ACPVVFANLVIAVHDVADAIEAPELQRDVLSALRIRLDDAMADRGIDVRDRTGFEVIVDDVHARSFVPAIDGAMPPVEDDVVDVIKIAPHSHRAIPSGVAGEEIVVERVVRSAPGSAERVVKGVEGFAG